MRVRPPPGRPSEDLLGLYDVGGASFDTTGLPYATPFAVNGHLYGLGFPFGDSLALLSIIRGPPEQCDQH